MTEQKTKDRISFLAEKFDVFDGFSEDGSPKPAYDKIEGLKSDGFTVQVIGNEKGEGDFKLLAITWTKPTSETNSNQIKRISIEMKVFSNMIAADPTTNKSCVQWMLNTFTRLVWAGGDFITAALRFAIEDLPQASTYISLFEANKRKQSFKNLCKGSFIIKDIKDPTDINQYKSLSQLFDAVDPFIVRQPSAVERTLLKFVETGNALIPVKDRKFTLYIPKTTAASTVFDGYANWCTARRDSSMFTHYTSNKTSLNTNSNLYIIINNDFFKNESQELYQIHFESNQIKDRTNASNVNIYESVLKESEGISNFFYSELMTMAKANKTGIEKNIYLDYLIAFGFAESLFELLDENLPSIKISTREIPVLPDISKFKNLESLVIVRAKLSEIHHSIGELMNLEILSLAENNLKFLPKEIGKLKNLNLINILGNKLEYIPEEIKYLDRSNGGSLFRLAVKKDDVGNENYQKLERLLPNVRLYSSQ